MRDVRSGALFLREEPALPRMFGRHGSFQEFNQSKKGTNMKQRGKTNRMRAALKKKSVKKNLRKSRGERKDR
jgi:hypothetical protein